MTTPSHDKPKKDSTQRGDVVLLSEPQKQLLELSEDDIRNNRVVSQEQLDKDDKEWLYNH
jgi:hypothetical protein